jgi:hypothetical protein
VRFLSAFFVASIQLSLLPGGVDARPWADKSGEYELEADLISFDDDVVVLRRADKELAAMEIAQLSDADRDYLKSDEAKAEKAKSFAAPQKWTLRDGQVIQGKIVDFADRDVTIVRRRGRIFVNDRLMNNLPEFYRDLIPQIVAHDKQIALADGRALRRWLVDQGEQPHVFHVQGVVIEDEHGDELAVPFFLFADADLKLLRSGWDEWLAAHDRRDYASEADHAFLLRSLAAARQQDQNLQREIALMQLTMQSVQAGVTSLWEVTLYPAAGQGGPPLWVVAAGRDSNQATIVAMEQNPGYVAGPVRRVSRRNR